jgi:hypothetical protein
MDRRTAQFMPPHRSGDAAIWESDDLMARRVRNQVLNEPQIKRIRDAIEDLIVGPGVMTFADPSIRSSICRPCPGTRSIRLPARTRWKADELFEEWFCDPKQFDLAGKRSGPDIQRMLVGENVERGGCLLLRTAINRPGRILPLCYQIVEYDQLDRYDRPAGPGINKIIHGIELDAQGREVAFHIFDDHPYDDFAGASSFGKSSRISAERVIHTAPLPPPQPVAGRQLGPCLRQPSFDRDKFMGAEIQSAAKAALLLLIHKMKNLKAGGNLGLLDGDVDSDPYGNEEMKLGNSPVALKIHADDDVKVLEGTRPTDSAESFIGHSRSRHGRRDRPVVLHAHRPIRANVFTSVRAAKLDEDAHFRPLQNWFARRVALPVRREFHRQAIGLGLLKSVTADQYLANPRQFNRFDAIGAGPRACSIRNRDERATTGLLRSCLTTLKQQSCARRGLHWIRVLAANRPREPRARHPRHRPGFVEGSRRADDREHAQQRRSRSGRGREQAGEKHAGEGRPSK